MDLLKLFDSKLGFFSEFDGVVQARASRELKSSAAGTASTVAAAASQWRSASLTIVTVLRQDVHVIRDLETMPSNKPNNETKSSEVIQARLPLSLYGYSSGEQ